MTECCRGGAHAAHVKTSDFYRTCNLPKRFDNPSWFHGYGNQDSKPKNILYRTTAQDYGWLPPSPHTVPVIFRPLDSRFSNAALKFGMYRNYSLNATPNPDATIPWTRGAAARKSYDAILLYKNTAYEF